MDNTAAQVARPFASLSTTLVLTNRKLFACALLLMIAPLWFGQYLPMVDLPQHAAQITALKEMWRGNPLFTDVFEINWFTPYLLGYMVLYLLSLVVPIAVATQIVVSVALMAVPVLTGSLLRAAGGDERWKWLAIPCAYGFAFYWGFLSFLVAVPVALLFLIRTIRYAEAPTLRNALGVGCFAVFLFFCHVIALGFAGLVAASYIACRNYRDLKILMLRLVPYVAPLPLIASWMLFTHEREASVQTDPVVYGGIVERLIELFVQPGGSDFYSAPFLNVLLIAAILIGPAMFGSRFSRKPERWVPFVVGLVVWLAAAVTGLVLALSEPAPPPRKPPAKHGSTGPSPHEDQAVRFFSSASAVRARARPGRALAGSESSRCTENFSRSQAGS